MRWYMVRKKWLAGCLLFLGCLLWKYSHQCQAKNKDYVRYQWKMKEYKKVTKKEPPKVTKTLILKSEQKPSRVTKGPSEVNYENTSLNQLSQSDTKSTNVKSVRKISNKNKKSSKVPNKAKSVKKSAKVKEKVKQTQNPKNSLTVSEKCQCNIRSLRVKFKSVRVKEKRYKVPKKLHFIWIGTEIRDEYLENIENYVEQNPAYEVTLWTDSTSMGLVLGSNTTTFHVRDINKELPSFKRRDVIRKERKLVCKADIMRHEILYKYGGIYTDTDSWSIQPFGPDFRHSFVALDGGEYIQNCIMGFPRGSKYTEYVLSAVLESYQLSQFYNLSVSAKYGPMFLSTAFLQYNDPEIKIFPKEIVLEASGDSVVVQTFDGNWLEESHRAKEARERQEFSNMLRKRVEQQAKERDEEDDYDEEVEESYYGEDG